MTTLIALVCAATIQFPPVNMASTPSGTMPSLLPQGSSGSLFALAQLTAGTSVVTESFLDSIAWRESRNNPRAVGRAGELGAYQIKAIAVREVNRVFGTRYKHADAIPHGREIARLYCLALERQLGRRGKVTRERIDRAYRFGPSRRRV